MNRIFVMGDIHGSLRALKQCLDLVGFDYDLDILIQLGDVADGWSETAECVELLLTIKNLIKIRGNHDQWCNDWINQGITNQGWLMQGGQATFDSYVRTGLLVDYAHKKFFRDQLPYYILGRNDKIYCFTHGGFHRHHALVDQDEFDFAWDRDLFMQAMSYKGSMTEEAKAKYKFKLPDGITKVFVGHTPVQHFGTDKPIHAGPVINLDTGCAFKGTLTIMNLDTEEFWQSEPSYLLYPEEKGRN